MNQATMIVAVQEYLDRRFVASARLKVTKVESRLERNQSWEFTIICEGPDE